MMKKVFTLLMLVCVMLGAVTGTAWGAAAYVDRLADGSWQLEDNAHQDAVGTVVGLEFPVQKFQFGMEFLKASLETPCNHDIDITGYEVKTGYRIAKISATSVYLTASYNRFELDDVDVDFSGVLIGVDVNSKLSNKWNVDAAATASVSGDAHYFNHNEDATLITGRLKLNYQFAPDWSANAGYRYYRVQDDHHTDYRLSGLTVGVTYRF